ncbi:ComEA family DNA-binding protein [Salisediminibacterium halotolerans]|uniref:Helix-hairpin-helix motif-containing protein n=1 Tax=Salisediminibacterium halotolerans TaxID=517425 RepID=A0A1H9TTW8_9BACI|nr:helix-hairpin-helix domain-containing protein [Salisediminibacterium haloalkalitolerans]SES00422.1 Helix-hairpin-helix motif-containing protein [Salisediminibacterium haloalkalitolerans]
MLKRVLVVLAAIVTIGWLLPFFKELKPVKNQCANSLRVGDAVKPADKTDLPEQTEEAAEDDRIDLNRADFDQLLYIPGVGTDFAHRIINERRRVKGFQSVDDLLKIQGVGEKRLDLMRERIKV